MAAENATTQEENIPKGSPKTPAKVKIIEPYAYVEELVVSSPSERNWRGIFIALLVIVAVLGLIVFSIVLVSPPEEGPRNRGAKPSLEDIFLKLPPISKFNGTWISDSTFIYKDPHGAVMLYDAENLTSRIIMTNSTFRQYDAHDFKISNDLKYVLLICDVRKIYKYSTIARYYVYEIASRLKKPLSPKELDIEAPFLQYATWSPDGTGVAFIHENDIYYKPKVEKNLVCRITNTGKTNEMYNGLPDWLYENEILKTSHAVWFSPNGEYLLYATFNDTFVGDYRYTWYGSADRKILYPLIKSFRYPKAGTKNPEVKIWTVNLSKPKYLFPQEVKSPKGVERDSYLTSIAFHKNENVSSFYSVWLNRYQNISVILTCTVAQNGSNCTKFHIEKEHVGWTEPIFDPVFNTLGTQAIIRLPVKDGENGHYMHACQIFNNNVIPLTHGAFEVTKILAWDEEKHLIYAIATLDHDPGVRHIFKIGDANYSYPWTCLTCGVRLDTNITTLYYQDYYNDTVLNDHLMGDYSCEYNNGIFSNSNRFYIQECLGPDVPVVFLVETLENARLAILDAGNNLRMKMTKLAQPHVKRIQVEIEFGYKAQVRLFLPPVLREYEEVAFPLILLVDASPFSQTVSSEWKVGWELYLTSTRGYVVAQIDARGSGFQGIQIRKEILKRIGSTEVQDQLAVLTYLRDTFKFIDRGKICTVGTGYGGYVSAMMLLQDFHQVINCSVSISPITNWLHYNSFFTEKYLGLPSKHPEAYEHADLLNKVGNLFDRHFLLMHGTADTKVTPQHVYLMSKALISQDVLFQNIAYPDETHEFSKKSLLHMFRQIDQFFNDSFGPMMDEWSDDSTTFFI